MAEPALAIPHRRELVTNAYLLAKEKHRRLARRRCLHDLRYIAELLYPPDDDSFTEFWVRFSEPAEWLLQLCLAWKERASVEVLPGFEIVTEQKQDKARKLERPEVVDLSNYRTLLVRQSRETLKTAVRRLDLVHDLMWWPRRKGTPCASAWFAHKLPEAYRNGDAIKAAMCSSDAFFDVWGGILVPNNRDPDNWGTKDYFDTPERPKGVPEHSAVFLAVKARYEGGRYKLGHFDDLVTLDDYTSAAVREEKKVAIKARENERDRRQGIRAVQGTDHHPQDAYQDLQKQRGVLTVKLPAVHGEKKRFFDFAALDDEQRREQLDAFTDELQPVFPHLDLITLAESYDQQERLLFTSQMLLEPTLGGMNVFDSRVILVVKREAVPAGLPCYLFCDPAFKLPENKNKGDHLAAGIVGWDRHGRRVVLDGIYRRDYGQNDAFHEFGSLIRTWRPRAFYMEQNLQVDINPHWQTHAMEQGLPITYIMPLERAGKANKMVRIKALEPEFRNGRIVLIEGTPIAQAILKEADGYDAIVGPEEWDDALDMLAQSYDPAVGQLQFWDDEDQKAGGRGRRDEEDDEIWLP